MCLIMEKSKKPSTITLRVSSQEREFIEGMAEFEGKSMSEMIKDIVLENLEDSYDVQIADLAYQNYLACGKKSTALSDYAKEIDIEL